ncbi:MAG: hypothetical protein R3297_00980, partial [Desulfobulbales bacterium]|nr:hypothetical protein [Desulfobulbales bacterium]
MVFELSEGFYAFNNNVSIRVTAMQKGFFTENPLSGQDKRDSSGTTTHTRLDLNPSQHEAV